MTKRISVSKYEKFQTCRRLFYWEHVLHMERVRQDGARGFGKLFHDGMEAWWRLAGQGPPPPWAKAPPTDRPLVAALEAISAGSKHVDTDRYDVAKTEAMMVGYHAKWCDLEYELVGGGVEAWFEAELKDPDGYVVKGWSVVGRKDAMARVGDVSRPRIVEHKSTSADISPGKDYWIKLQMDMQPSMYVDSAIAAGFDVASVLYDVSSKPDVSPERETPEADREMTIGRGCKVCGGSAKAGEVARGTGRCSRDQADAHNRNAKKVTTTDGGDVEVACPACVGTGWKPGDEPRHKAFVNLKDEPVDDYRARVLAAIDRDPDACFKHVDIPRKGIELAEARADLVAATSEMDALFDRARAVSPGGNLRTPNARRAFARNTRACFQQYGRPCDWLEVCQSKTNPYESKLYQIKTKGQPT